MAPAHAPGPADPGPAPGFEHEKYDFCPPEPEKLIVGLGSPIPGAMDTIVGELCNGIQRVQLAQGLSMRPADPLPCTYAPGYDHSELKKMIDASEPSQAHELGQLWNDLGNEIMDFGASLQHTATSSEAIWVGQAGNTARAALSALATWSQHTGQGVQFMGTTVRTQAEAAHTAKAAMPDPVLYDPATYQAQLNSTTNPADWVRIMGDAREQADRQDTAHADAVRVIETYSASLRGTNTAMPAFTPPPRFGTGDTGRTPTGPAPGGRASGVVPPPAGGGVAGGAPDRGDGPLGADVSEPGHSGAPPSPTPGQSASYPLPGGLPAGESGGEPGEPSFLPAAAAGTGAAGPGERGTSTSGRHAGGGFGPRGSGALSASSLAAKLTPSRLAANPLAANPLGLGDGGATGTGRGTGGLPGSGSGFAPVSGTGRGRGEGDTEHRRPSYLIETEDIWGDGRRVPPPVIGADPPERHR